MIPRKTYIHAYIYIVRKYWWPSVFSDEGSRNELRILPRFRATFFYHIYTCAYCIWVRENRKSPLFVVASPRVIRSAAQSDANLSSCPHAPSRRRNRNVFERVARKGGRMAAGTARSTARNENDLRSRAPLTDAPDHLFISIAGALLGIQSVLQFL